VSVHDSKPFDICAASYIGASYGSGNQSGCLPGSPLQSGRLGGDRPVTQLVPAGGEPIFKPKMHAA
jgi:hypothetical protein